MGLEDDDSALVMLAATPALVGGASCLIGRAGQHDGACWATILGAYLGAATIYPLGYLGYLTDNTQRSRARRGPVLRQRHHRRGPRLVPRAAAGGDAGLALLPFAPPADHRRPAAPDHAAPAAAPAPARSPRPPPGDPRAPGLASVLAPPRHASEAVRVEVHAVGGIGARMRPLDSVLPHRGEDPQGRRALVWSRFLMNSNVLPSVVLDRPI